MSRDASTPDDATRPVHPFWCDRCWQRAVFRLRGCPIPHEEDCDRYGEDAEAVYAAAWHWCKRTGKGIP